MLKVELRSLEHEDLILEEIGPAQVLGIELEPELSPEPLEIHCEISKGHDLISAKGWVKGKMLLTCDRCAREFSSPYKSFFEIHYRAQNEGEEAEPDEVFPDGEMEIVYFEGDLLDLADQVRQTVLLSVPMRAICREECRGLCSGCGRDLNFEECVCTEPPPDSRWDVLKKLKF